MSPRTKKWILFALVDFGIVTLGALAFVGIRHSPQRSTRYVGGFDEAKFAQVEVGDALEDVLLLLGEPLVTSQGPKLDYLNYTQPMASPDHMVRRCVAVDRDTGRVAKIDDAVHYGYVSHWFSGGTIRR